NENLELGWSEATVTNGVFTGTDGTATFTIGGTQYSGNSSSVVIDSLDTEIVVELTANEEGKKGVLRTGGESGLSFPDDAAVTVGKVTTYTFTLGSLGVTDLATFVALNVAFEDNNPDGGNTEAPTDAISVELWDNFGNLLDYGQYSSTEVPEGLPVIGAKIQYSYDGNAWNELADTTNLVYDGSRYVFNASVATVFLKVISVEGGFLASAALEGIDDGYKVWEGPVENGKVYTLNEQKAYDLKYDDGNKTITWSDDSDKYGVDGVVQNGTVKIISAVDSEGNNVLNDSEPFMQNEHEGYVSVKAGATVTVQIKPNYGYQFISGSLNGNVVTAGSEVSIFTFTMPKTNLHLSALFTKSEDKVIAEAKDVTGAEIVGGEKVIDSGNLELTVTDSAISDADKNKLQSSDAASDVEVKSWLEVDLAQIVNKGSSTEVWRKDLEELTDKITVTLQVGTDLDASKQYVVVREHQGAYEKIPAIYDATAGTLTFESDKFSNYAVGTVEPKQDIQDVPEGETKQSVQEVLDGGWSNAPGAAAEVVSDLLSNFTVAKIASEVQAADGTVNTALLTMLKSLEDDYAIDKSIVVNQEPAIDPAVSGSINGKVSVMGAAFNAADSSSVQLVIGDKAGSGIAISSSSYSKAVQLDLKLMQTRSSGPATAIEGNLRMPLTITMPVPNGIDSSKLEILHDKNGDGTSDETVPYSLASDIATFTVTHLSNFAFAERASSDDSDASSDSQSSTSSTAVTDSQSSTFSTAVTDSQSSTPSTAVTDSQSSTPSTAVKEETVSVPIEYIVVKGDTLGKIARRNHMSLSALLALNPQIKNPNLIRPGQKIVVGFTGKIVASQTNATNPNAEYYVVQKGDYLYKIARKNKLSLAQLAALNPEIMSQRYIYAGQKIRVK
ncbi:MAG: LysM peptidoglycan-binding domain-containing protein, partial [Suilimivivens sp.]